MINMMNNINSAALFKNIFRLPATLSPKDGGTAPTPSGQKTDTVEISLAARLLESQAEQMSIVNHMREMRDRQAAARAEWMEFNKQMENAREAAEAQAEHFRQIQIAMEIAGRIMRGDNVPQTDKNFLLEHSPGLYKLAMTARNFNNENPKDHEALAKDENASPADKIPGQNTANHTGTAVTAAAPSTPAASTSGQTASD